MNPYLTYFDSKRYLSFKRFEDYYDIRKKHFAVLPEQEEEYRELFRSQSIRYTFQVQSTWMEETFESMDGNYVTFYHDLVPKEELHAYLQDTLTYFEYAYGGVGIGEDIEKAVFDQLTALENFTYELDTIVYRTEAVECYIAVTVFPHGNFALKVFEKEDYEPAVKKRLIATIHEALQPILKTI